MIMPDSLKQYMQGIREYPLISKDEEVLLANKIKEGDDDALNKLVGANLRLVITIAMDMKNRGLNLEDLISEGNLGLIHAAKKFDPAKGAKFSTYAAYWIKQFMRVAITESNKVIRIPTSSLRKIRKVKQLKREMTEELGRIPTDKEIADKSEFSENLVHKLKDAELKTISLQSPVKAGETDEMIHMIPDEKGIRPDTETIDNDMAKQMYRILPKLNDREQLIIRHRFGLNGKRPHTLEEISGKLDLTRERVRQLQNRALEKMRKCLSDDRCDNCDCIPA